MNGLPCSVDGCVSYGVHVWNVGRTLLIFCLHHHQEFIKTRQLDYQLNPLPEVHRPKIRGGDQPT